ncbi:MAG: ATP-grasp domain-containing protein [Kiritimatiellia bacterium]|nr:ATP-grasp domain-containing protein [Kiritimatiellia bacterium]
MKRKGKIRAAIVYDAFIPRNTAVAASEVAAVVADACQVQQALSGSGVAAVLLPVNGNIFEVIAAVKKIKPAVVVNLCESFRDCSSYEAQIAGLLELVGCPYTGNCPSALDLCQDKFRTKAVLRACGLPTPKGWLAGNEKDIPDNAGFPLIVKPNFEDGGIGIYADSVVHDRKALTAGVNRIVMKYKQPALIEEFIAGREFNVAVIENPETQAPPTPLRQSAPPRRERSAQASAGRVKILPLSEISFAGLSQDLPRLVGYEAKWTKGHPFYIGTVPVCPAKDVSGKTAESLRKLAIRTWQIMRLCGYARIDIRVAAGGKPHIIDVNPNPDSSYDAGLARSLKAAGISLNEFWYGQVMSAIERNKRRA